MTDKDKTKLPPSGLLNMDFNDIDDALLGPGAWEQGRVAKPHAIAPASGDPFLHRARPIQETLKKFSPLFWR